MSVKPIPDGYHSVTAFLNVSSAATLVAFLKQAFDAKEKEFQDLGDGHIHAEVRIGDSLVMIGQSEPRPASIYLYVNDADAAYRSALKAGAISLSEPVDQPYGDRQGGVKDPCGNTWWIATHKEDVSPEEIRRRFEARAKQPRG